MSSARQKQVSGTIDIAAEPKAIFAILTNPHEHHRIDGSGTIGAVVEGPETLMLGSEFGMKVQRKRFGYSTRNKVVEYEKDRLIAWKHKAPHRWRYELTSLADGKTRVVETFDYSGYGPFSIFMSPMAKHNKRSIDATLVRLKDVIEERPR